MKYFNKNWMMILMGVLSAGQAWGCEKPQTEVEYHFVDCLSEEGLTQVWLFDEQGSNAKHGFVNKAGKLVIPLQYDRAWGFKDGLAGVQKDENGLY